MAQHAVCTARSVHLSGMTPSIVPIEVRVEVGGPSMSILGLSEHNVRESRVRVCSAFDSAKIDLSGHKITVNFPSDGRLFHGSGHDLAIAVALLAALGKIQAGAADGLVMLGELSLTGALRTVRGVIPAVRGIRELGIERVMVPSGNVGEASFVDGVEILPVQHLSDVVAGLCGEAPFENPVRREWTPVQSLHGIDISEVRGLASGRRALEVAAAGGHDLVIVGAPGSGKTMLAQRLSTILPFLSKEEALEVSAVHSALGMLTPEFPALVSRPFQAPHFMVSEVGLLGGGGPARPGTISMAHHGVLFVDELAEWKPRVLDALIRVRAEGRVTIARGDERATFPARPLLVGAINPCPCGYAGERQGRCTCPPERVRSYRARLSGPLLDRIDLHVALPPVDVVHLQSAARGEPSAPVRERVMAARAAQAERARRGGAALTNATLAPRDLERLAAPDAAGARVLAAAMDKLGLSARAYSKVLRVARTVADLDGSDAVRAPHVAEAVHARLFDRDPDAAQAARAVP